MTIRKNYDNEFGLYLFLVICVIGTIKTTIDLISKPSYDSFFWFSLSLWWLVLPLIVWAFEKISTYIELKKIYAEPCTHGVKGGKTKLQCEVCKLEGQRLRDLNLQSGLNKVERENLIQKNDKVKLELEKLFIEKLKSEISYYRSMDPYKFESEVAKLYEEKGYSVEVTSKSNDEGKDIILTKDNEVTYVECKRFNENTNVSRPIVQKLYGVMVADGVKKGIVVSTSGFTKEAIEFSMKKDVSIELIDSQALMEMLKPSLKINDLTQVYHQYCTSDIFLNSPDPETLDWLKSKNINFFHKPCGDLIRVSFEDNSVICINNHENTTISSGIRKVLLSEKNSLKIHFCPKCGGKLVKKKQSFSNKNFLGCANYPTCMFTRNI